jgi:hypothetical protein
MISHRVCSTDTLHTIMRRAILSWRPKGTSMSFISRLAMVVIFGAPILLISVRAFAQDGGPVARWSFDNATGPSVRDPENKVSQPKWPNGGGSS